MYQYHIIMRRQGCRRFLMRTNSRRKRRIFTRRRATSALRPSGRGGTFGYTRIECGANRQRIGREGSNGAAEDSERGKRRGEKRGSAGEAVSRLHREPQKAGDNIALKGTNTIAGMECPGKWTEEEPPHRRGNRRKTARSRRAADTIRGKKHT